MIQSVQRAAQILAVLGSGTPRLGVTEIADRVGLAKPTVHGLLRTLEAHELVAQDPDTGKYSLGAGVLQLGNAYLDGSDLRARSLRWAEALGERAGEAVVVAPLYGSRVIVLHHVFRPDNTVQILEVGAAIPWHACALGHAIVAFVPEALRARALAGGGGRRARRRGRGRPPARAGHPGRAGPRGRRGGPGRVQGPGRGTRRRRALRAELTLCGSGRSLPLHLFLASGEDLRGGQRGRFGVGGGDPVGDLGHARRADAQRPHAEAEEQRQDQRVG